MNIGLDWDNTFTRDTAFWEKFLRMSKEWGNRIWITTSRGIDTPIEYVPEGLEGIVYCEYRAKRIVTEERGIKIDIWIDDDPAYIDEGFVV